MGKVLLASICFALVIPASAQAWSDSVRVGSTVREWTSPQSFARNDQIQLRISVGRRELQDYNGLARCRSHRYGAGIAVTFDACGRHLKLRFANSGAPKTVRILYRRM